MIITIDGPSASGKGTLAKRLARHFSLPHLDTGTLYRMVAFEMLSARLPLDDVASAVAIARRMNPLSYEDDLLRGPHMGEAASVVSALPELRSALLDFQVAFAHQPAGAVLDGRDCGTVIAPDADAKFFVTASSEARARRRWDELVRKGDETPYESVLADILRRDERDSSRSTAPLRMAADAVLIDTTLLDVDAMVEAARLSIPEALVPA